MREFKSLEINIGDADWMERYENALYNLRVRKKPSGKKASQIIRYKCDGIRGFFDDIYGEGTSKELFGDGYNIMTHTETLDEFIKLVADNSYAVTAEFVKKSEQYSSSRAQRRSK